MPLKLEVQYHGIPPMPEAQKKKSAVRLAEFAAREAAKREVEKARNELESYIVNTRSKLNDDEITGVRKVLHNSGRALPQLQKREAFARVRRFCVCTVFGALLAQLAFSCAHALR